MRLVRKAVLGVTVLALAALSGCGAGGERADAADEGQERAQRPGAVVQALRTVARKTEEAKSVRVEQTISVDAEDGFEAKVSGVMSWDPVAMDLTTIGTSAAPRGRGPVEIRTVLVDNVVYVNLGEEAAREFGGKPWLKVDVEKAAEEAGDPQLLDRLLGGGQSTQQQNPHQRMGLLLESSDVERVGRQTLDGVVTEYYSGVLTVTESLERDPASDHLTAEEREELLGKLAEAGIEGLEIDIWVDERNYPVRIDTRMSMPGVGAEFTVSERYSDYGTPVSVTAPPADRTADMMELEAGPDGAVPEPDGV